MLCSHQAVSQLLLRLNRTKLTKPFQMVDNDAQRLNWTPRCLEFNHIFGYSALSVNDVLPHCIAAAAHPAADTIPNGLVVSTLMTFLFLCLFFSYFHTRMHELKLRFTAGFPFSFLLKQMYHMYFELLDSMMATVKRNTRSLARGSRVGSSGISWRNDYFPGC